MSKMGTSKATWHSSTRTWTRTDDPAQQLDARGCGDRGATRAGSKAAMAKALETVPMRKAATVGSCDPKPEHPNPRRGSRDEWRDRRRCRAGHDEMLPSHRSDALGSAPGLACRRWGAAPQRSPGARGQAQTSMSSRFVRNLSSRSCASSSHGLDEVLSSPCPGRASNMGRVGLVPRIDDGDLAGWSSARSSSEAFSRTSSSMTRGRG